MLRERPGPESIASSGSASQPPTTARSMSALCRRRCSMSRGRSAPAARSRKPTNCSPTAAARHDHLSIEARAPPPRSISLTLDCDSRAAALRPVLESCRQRAELRPSPSRVGSQRSPPEPGQQRPVRPHVIGDCCRVPYRPQHYQAALPAAHRGMTRAIAASSTRGTHERRCDDATVARSSSKTGRAEGSGPNCPPDSGGVDIRGPAARRPARTRPAARLGPGLTQPGAPPCPPPGPPPDAAPRRPRPCSGRRTPT